MKFPVLRMNEFHIRRFRSLSELELMSEEYFKDGKFGHEAFFIDSEGIKWTLVQARRKRRSLNPFRWFRESPAIIVDNQVERAALLTMDEVKNTILTLGIKEKWFRQGHQTETQFRHMIADAHSIPDIIDRISFYGDWVG